MNLSFSYKCMVQSIQVAVSGILLMGSLHAAQVTVALGVQGPNVRYMVELSPDASRVAIAKWQEDTKWELFEGTFQQNFRKLPMPAGHRADNSIVYSPNGKSLIFETMAERPVAKLPSEKSEPANAGLTTLWRQPIGIDGESAPQKIFERALSITNVLPLADGSLVFMGKVDEVKSHSWSPITGSNRVWSQYQWMLRKPDGTVNVINPRAYAFFATASLIRDEAVFLVQERRVNRQSLNPEQYYLDVTDIKPGADLSALERLGNMQDRHGGPDLQCDWAGKTCARSMTLPKDGYGYYTHQLELIREGKVCRVQGLPDRIERMVISRSGNAVALITRPTPRKNIGYKLARVTVKADGCAGDTQYFELP